MSVYYSFQYGSDLWSNYKSKDDFRLEGSCDFSVMEGVKLSKEDICAIDLIKDRCGKLDKCFVDCYTSGRGVDIGGGCGHLCNYGWKIDWKPPEGTKACYGE